MSGESHLELFEDTILELIGSIEANVNSESAESDLEELKDNIAQLSIELGNVVDKERKRIWKDKVTGFERKLSELRRLNLLGDSANAKKSPFDDQTKEIQASLDKQSQMLMESRKVLQETEEVAINTMMDLAAQREKIQQATNSTKELNDDLTASNKILNRMNKWWRG